jgi:hypothetical protein
MEGVIWAAVMGVGRLEEITKARNERKVKTGREGSELKSEISDFKSQI